MQADRVRAHRAASVLGHFALTTDWRLEGWCWSPDTPELRQAVDITVNGKTVATCVATQFNEMLRQAGMGDGRCGFSLSPPRQIGTAADGEAIVEARAQQCGTILGRVVFHPQKAFAASNQRLADLADHVAAAKARMPTIRSDRLHRIGAAMSAFGGSLRLQEAHSAASSNVGGQSAPLDYAIARLLRERRVDLPVTASPRISLILRAAPDWRTTLSALRHFAKAMPEATEAIVLDDGAQPLTRLLVIPVRGLRILPLCDPTHLSRTINRAVLTSRGEMLCIVEQAERLVAWDLQQHAREPDTAFFGSSAAAMLADTPSGRVIVAWRERPVSDGVVVLLKRMDFVAAGGLEQALDNASPAWPDFAFKLSALGVPLIGWADTIGRRQHAT